MFFIYALIHFEEQQFLNILLLEFKNIIPSIFKGKLNSAFSKGQYSVISKLSKPIASKKWDFCKLKNILRECMRLKGFTDTEEESKLPD